MPDQWEINPNLSGNVAQGGVADVAGGSTYSGVVTGETAGDVAFGGPTADFINNGVVNGLFVQTSFDTASNIDPTNNPVPYWVGPTQVAGGAFTCTVIADASSPSGQNLRFTMNANGTASDEAYVEQIVDIGGARDRAYAHALRTTVMNTGAVDFTATQELQYLTTAGVATGIAESSSSSLAAGVTAARRIFKDSPPADARFMRIRIGAARGAAATTATGTIEYPSVRLEHQMGRVWLPEESVPATYNPGYIAQDTGTVFIQSGTGKGLYLNSGPYIVTEQAAPGTPDSGTYSIYAKTDGILYGKNDGGTEVALAGGGGTFTVIRPAVGGTVNNWAPAGLAPGVIAQPSLGGVNRICTGISATGMSDGSVIFINVGGANTFTLNHLDAGSTAANQIKCPGAANYGVTDRSGVILWYDATASLWVFLDK